MQKSESMIWEMISRLREGKDKNSISISGVSNQAYKVEGPWEQRENVPVILPKTCMESTYVDFEGDTNQYAVVKNGDGYDIFRKTQDMVGGYPVYENTWIWRHDDEMAGKVKEDATIDAIVLDYDMRDADLFAKAGDSGYNGLYYNWDENYFAYCKLTKILDTGMYLGSDLEQVSNPDELPEGWEFQIVGDNYGTQYWGDLCMIGKANISKKSVTIGSLKSKVKIYVQVRAVSTNENGIKSYGAWSTAVNVKTK